MRVYITVQQAEFDRLVTAWSRARTPYSDEPVLSLTEYLQLYYNIEVYDWDQDNNYRLWFRNTELAMMFRLRHG